MPDDTKQERADVSCGDKERRADSNGTSAAAAVEADDPVHKALGDFGWWQFWIALALSLLKFPIAWHQLAIIFLAARTPFQCDVGDATALPNVTDTRCTSRDPVTLAVVPCQRFTYDRSVFQETIITEVLDSFKNVCTRRFAANRSRFRITSLAPVPLSSPLGGGGIRGTARKNLFGVFATTRRVTSTVHIVLPKRRCKPVA